MEVAKKSTSPWAREDAVKTRHCPQNEFLSSQMKKFPIGKNKQINKQRKAKEQKPATPPKSTCIWPPRKQQKIVTDMRFQLFCREVY